MRDRSPSEFIIVLLFHIGLHVLLCLMNECRKIACGFYKFFTDSSFLYQQVVKLKQKDTWMLGIRFAGLSPLCNVNFTDSSQDTPLHIAARKNNHSCLRYLLRKKPIVNCFNDNKQTPLFIAVDLMQEDNVKLLLEYGADVNIVDSNSRTCLCYLLKIDPFVKYFGRNILAYCAIVKLLIDNGAKISSSSRQLLEKRANIRNLFGAKSTRDDNDVGGSRAIFNGFRCYDLGDLSRLILSYIKSRQIEALNLKREDKNSLFYKEYFYDDVFRKVLEYL